MMLWPDNSWIKEKKSWLVTTNSSGTGNFDSVDPVSGTWDQQELTKLLGKDFTVLPLKGKWEGEVLVFSSHESGHLNRLAGTLSKESLGEYHKMYGNVLMTMSDLIV